MFLNRPTPERTQERTWSDEDELRAPDGTKLARAGGQARITKAHGLGPSAQQRAMRALLNYTKTPFRVIKAPSLGLISRSRNWAAGRQRGETERPRPQKSSLVGI